MLITTLSHFLRLTKIELAEVTALVLDDVDLTLEVRNKSLTATSADEQDSPKDFSMYEVSIQGVSHTIQMDAESEYQYLLGILGTLLSTYCTKISTIALKNCNLGVYDVETQDFFIDLQRCSHLKILNLSNNALWGMTDWINASDLFNFLSITDLDLSSNGLFDLDVLEDPEDDMEDATETWSDFLSVLEECRTLKTLNLADNFVENAIRCCPTEITRMLKHMIVHCGTYVNLDNNKLSYLTPQNLRLLLPSASASESTTTELSREVLESQLSRLIDHEIEVHDKALDFDVSQFRDVVTLSSSAAHVSEERKFIKQCAEKSDGSLAGLTTAEELLPPCEDTTQHGSFFCKPSVDLKMAGATLQPQRRLLKVTGRPTTGALLRSLDPVSSTSSESRKRKKIALPSAAEGSDARSSLSHQQNSRFFATHSSFSAFTSCRVANASTDHQLMGSSQK